jgi:hypothetical protein
MREKFEERNHRPSARQLVALRQLIRTLEDMATGKAEPKRYLSSADPGLGKTTAISCFVDAMLSHPPQFHDVGVLICLGRIEEVENMVEALVKEAAVPRDVLCVKTSDKALQAKLEALGHPTSPNAAQVLVATQQGLENRVSFRGFRDVSEFHFNGHPRTVCCWDETFLPGNPITLDRLDLLTLPRLFVGRKDGLSKRIEKLASVDLTEAAVDKPFLMPDFATDFDVTASQLLAGMRINETSRKLVEALWAVSGCYVSVRKDLSGGTVVDYQETIPDDFAPLLICDASGRVRDTYNSMERDRGNLVRLPRAYKSYKNLTVHLWDRGGGKGAYADEQTRPVLIEGIAKTLDTKPDQEWLVIHHLEHDKDADGKPRKTVKDEVEALLQKTPHANVKWLTWGRHMATNAFQDIRNCIIAGPFSYPPSSYEAIKRLASGRRAADGPVTKEEMKETEEGEHQHHILQGGSRIAIRKSDGEGCFKADLYLIASTRTGVPQLIPVIFPGCSVADWQPVRRVLGGHVKAAFEVVEAWLRKIDPSISIGETEVHGSILDGASKSTGDLYKSDRRNLSILKFKTVAKAVGTSTKHFKTHVRSHPDFIHAVSELGVVEWKPNNKNATGFWMPFPKEA